MPGPIMPPKTFKFGLENSKEENIEGDSLIEVAQEVLNSSQKLLELQNIKVENLKEKLKEAEEVQRELEKGFSDTIRILEKAQNIKNTEIYGDPIQKKK